MTDLVLVMTTMPDDHRADELARTLIDERLAACVTVGAPMTSTYRWKGQVETSAERQLLIKTLRSCVPALEARVRALHPYEVPEWLTLDARGSDGYARWITAAVAGG
jgi:periplasmic divalent cation tolerance protein